jgi:hypothetical protein
MATTFNVKNGTFYLTTAGTGSSGITYEANKKYSGITDNITIDGSAYVVNFKLDSDATPSIVGRALSSLSPGEVSLRYNSSYHTDKLISNTFNNEKYYSASVSGPSNTLNFYGDSSGTTDKYTTTITTEYFTYDSVGLNADNCDLYYGSLSNKASASGYTYTFDTPDGGGSTKIWFCKKGTTTPYTGFSYISDIEGTDYEQADDGSITVTLDNSDDTEIQLFGSGSSPTSKVNVELDFTSLTINDIEVGSYSDLVIGYHFDTTTEVKVEYDGSDIAVSYEQGAYTEFFVSFYKKDGSAYSMRHVTVSTGSGGGNWQVSDNVAVCTLAASGNSRGNFSGPLYDATGTASKLNIISMTTTDDKDFVSSYSGAALTYTPANGYEYTTGDNFDLQVVISGGWKFDTTAACVFRQRGGGNPYSTEVTFVDEHTAKASVDGFNTNPIVWFNGMVGLKDEEPEPDYATFITPYIVSKANVNHLASAIWISEDGSTITAMDNILSYKEIYDTLDSDVSQEIKLGGYSSGTTAKYLVDYTHTRNLGGVDIEEYWHNADDYENTTVRVYVPLIGLVDVETGQVMGHKLYLEYRYEIIDGKALAVLYTDSYSPESIIYQGSCNFAIDEPINSNNIDSYANSYWTILSAQLGDLKPYVLIDRKQPASGLAEEIGNKVQIAKKVKECSGYTEFEYITVSGLEATNSEYAEIVSLLTSGVIV